MTISDVASLRIRVDWLEGHSDVYLDQSDDALRGCAVKEVPASELVVDVCIDQTGQAELRLLERIVANHFQKIMNREDQMTASHAAERLVEAIHVAPPKNELELKMAQIIASPVLFPRYLYVGVAPSEGEMLVLPGLLFSTASFIDANEVPYVLVSRYVDFRSAIISAFNSTLDLINIREQLYVGPQRHRGQQVFRGLNSQRVEIEFAGQLCVGYIRKDTANYVL